MKKKILIVIGADHAGFKLKEVIKKYLSSLSNHQIEDVGTFRESSVDYPDIVEKAVAKYLTHPSNALGILICGTGIGMCIAANKFSKIYCALAKDAFTAKMARAHNQANFLAMGARVGYQEKVATIIDSFLNTDNESGRHLRRFKKIREIEKSKNEVRSKI